RPAETAQPFHLVLLNGKRDLAGARIAADQANLASRHAVEHCRKVSRRGTGLARSDDQLTNEQLLKGLHLCIGTRDAEVVVDGGRAEVDEFGGIMSQPPGVAEKRVE